MAITHFLLGSNFNSNSLLQKTFRLHSFSRSFPTKSPCAHNIALKKNYSSYKPISVCVSPKFRTKCFIIDHSSKGEKGFGGNGGGEDHDLKKVAAVDSGMNKVLQIPIVTGILLGLWLLFDHHHFPLALAASSGGRMGARSFSSTSTTSSSSSSSSSSRSSSSPSYSSSVSYSSCASIPSSSSDGTYWIHTSSLKASLSSSSSIMYRNQTRVQSGKEPGPGNVVIASTFFAMVAGSGVTQSAAGPNTIETDKE